MSSNKDEAKVKIDEDRKNKLVAEEKFKDDAFRKSLINTQKLTQANLQAIKKEVDKEKDELKAKKIYAQLKKDVEELTRIKGQHGYIEFATAIMELLAVLVGMNEMMFYSHPATNMAKFVWSKTLEGTKPGKFIEETPGAIASIPGWALKKIGLKKDVEPKLTYQVEIADDGVLKTSVLHTAMDLTEEEKIMFDTGLVAWAELNGYTFDTNTQVLSDSLGNPMKYADFERLNQDDEHSLKAFFQGRYNLDVSPSPGF